MANYYGRSGAPMIQPTKDEYREWLSETGNQLREERRLRTIAEYKLRIATQKLGEMVLNSAVQEDLAITEERPPPKLRQLGLACAWRCRAQEHPAGTRHAPADVSD